MKRKEYDILVSETKSLLLRLQAEGEHPTLFLVNVIKETYGHTVYVERLMKLIETSPLKP